MKQTLENKKNELDQLNQKITQGRAAERRLPQLREEVRRTELDLQRLLQILPTARNAEELIKKIQALAGQGEFFLKKWAPKEYINKDFYAEWPIDLQVDGTYHNLALFFEKVARFSRIINIEDLVMVGYPGRGRRTHAGRELHDEDVHLSRRHGRGRATAAAAAPKKPGARRRRRRRTEGLGVMSARRRFAAAPVAAALLVLSAPRPRSPRRLPRPRPLRPRRPAPPAR